MVLTDLKIRILRPPEKITRHTDDRGLYVEVHPSGSKLWRYKYRYLGKQNRLALGRYPEVGLAEARARRDEARKKLEAGIDPLLERTPNPRFDRKGGPASAHSGDPGSFESLRSWRYLSLLIAWAWLGISDR
jgi:hypothetical protein